MLRCVVLTYTTNGYVDAKINYIFYFLTFLINSTELCIILPEIFWIKLKPD